MYDPEPTHIADTLQEEMWSQVVEQLKELEECQCIPKAVKGRNKEDTN